MDLALRVNIVGPNQTTSALALHCFTEDRPQYLLPSPGEIVIDLPMTSKKPTIYLFR